MYFGITPSGISYVTSKATAALPVSGWSRQRDRVVSCASDRIPMPNVKRTAATATRIDTSSESRVECGRHRNGSAALPQLNNGARTLQEVHRAA